MMARTALGIAAAALWTAAAAGQVSSDVALLAKLHEHTDYNDIWGYTHTNGDEYALLGFSTGISVINITDPQNPYEAASLAGPTSVWRDIKTFGTYAYVSTEQSGGIAIFDLSDPENPQALPAYTGINRAHNLYIDTATATLYTAGSNLGSGGTRILDLTDPEQPVEIGSWEDKYLHDVMVQNGVLYGSAIYQGALHVLDVSNPASVTTLGVVAGYAGTAFTHNAWVTPDDRYVMTTDEKVGAACRMWDVSALPAITQTDIYLPNPATIPHNAHIKGDKAYISHYTLGVRVVDVSDPSDLVEIAWYDTYPASDAGSSAGCWGAFPFFPQSPGLFLASDRATGLYVLELRVADAAGTVTHAGLGLPVPNAQVRITETTASDVTGDDGTYLVEAPEGSLTLEVSAFGYETAEVPVTLSRQAPLAQDVQLVPVPGASISGRVSDVSTGQPVPDAVVEVLGTPLSRTTDAAGDFLHPSVPTGSYTVRASAFGHNALEALVHVEDGLARKVDFALTAAQVAESFESGAGGWAVSGSALDGAFELGDPEGTAAQPEDDFTPGVGVSAWITGIVAGGAADSNDVDAGATVLTSPPFDVTGSSDPHFSFRRWYVTDAGATADDWLVEISSDAGLTWAVVERIGVANPSWVEVRGAVSAYVLPTPLVTFRFTAQDTGAASVTEAGVDDFTLYEVEFLDATTAPASVPAGLVVGPAAPNPVPAGAGVSWALSLAAPGEVTAVVYDVVGRRVAALSSGVRERGAHVLRWNGERADGSRTAAGTYFVEIRTPSAREARKVTLLR